MDDDLQIPQFFPILCIFAVVFCFGVWLWFWYDTWPPSALQISAAVLGTLIGGIYCLDRVQCWDVRAWEWRDEQRRNRTYPLFLYRILPFSGAVGVLATILIDRTLGKAVGLAFIPLVGTSVGLMFLWGTIEAIRHIAYHRVKK